MEERVHRFGTIFMHLALFASYFLGADSKYVFHKDGLSWSNAKEECADSGMILVTINSEQELGDLMAIFGTNITEDSIWTGLYTLTDTCSDYIWHGSGMASWYVWGSTEPNECIYQKCVRLRNGKMRTATCSSAYSFVCQSPQETMLEDGYTNITSGLVGGTEDPTSDLVGGTENSTSRMIGVTEVSTPDSLGNITCLCKRTAPNNTSQLRGIIPNSIAHRNRLLMTGYVPACSRSFQWGNGSISLNREEKQALLRVLRKDLNVAKNTTSLYRRRRISAPDNRPSATYMGVFGICILTGLLGSVVAIDATTLYMYWKGLQRNVK